MMAAGPRVLKDDQARQVAISAHHRSILVEAGAGSGKTAVMAGRIAMLLAEGAAPRGIAAVTFTELAASELHFRVREFVGGLLAGRCAAELRIALPGGLSPAQGAHLARAAAALDEITCSTIHGFCQRLIEPYPAEANIDPGAAIIDQTQGDLVFLELVDGWLREHLSGDGDGLIAQMVLHDPKSTVALVHRIAESLRKRRGLRAPPETDLRQPIVTFGRAVDAFAAFRDGTAARESDTEACIDGLRELMDGLAAHPPTVPTGLVRLLTAIPSTELITQKGTFKKYQKKGKWLAAAQRAGLSKADGEQLNATATGHYEACGDAWTSLRQAAASRALALLIDETHPILERYREYKRGSAQLDFDDLIFAARDLLRDHDPVRVALARRFRHVLVDEFQDTDPLQTEIFWRLCGEPPGRDRPGRDRPGRGPPGFDSSASSVPWSEFHIRPGALFLVGDPKQAIYRFRGADVAAYIAARAAFHAQDGESLLSIATNFRSRASILTFVNERFAVPLSAHGQPGFTALDAFHDDPAAGMCVVALDVRVADAEGKASAEQQRDAEAEAVAELCARLIGHRPVADRVSGKERLCQPGDIALLAPTGTDLWRYEEALERRGIPVATQAGKGLFRRQEIQDLIALTRVLADVRDTLALGALLRGPLVGLTEEALLDIVAALPRSEDAPERIPRFDLGVDAALVPHPLAADVLMKLQSLYRSSNGTTPHALLSQAVDQLRVRPVLTERHGAQADRALANVDLYLRFAAGYAVRGLQAFAEAMTAAWTDQERAVEGRPDAQEESVALFTMHAAKGLEWPVVIPINTMTGVLRPDSAVVDRTTDTFFCPILGVAPACHEAVLGAEKAELDRERVRLWYVAATRGRELLVLPRSDVSSSRSTWNALIELNLPGLPAIDPADLPPPRFSGPAASINEQTRVDFAAQAAAIADRQEHLVWRAPSRNEGESGPVLEAEEADIWTEGTDAFDESAPYLDTPAAVQGGRERGLILHKLMEEILTGEVHDDPAAVGARAAELIRSLGRTPVADPSAGLSPQELAHCVVRTLAQPAVAVLRPELVAEFPVYGIRAEGAGDCATAGIADALTLSDTGVPHVVVDWKSDVDPSPAALEHYRAQVRAYLDITGARKGLIVFMTSGRVVEVA